MRILVISTCFHPKNSIASYRIEAFARYFREAGHSVTVLTEGERDEVAAWHGCEIRYVATPLFPESELARLRTARGTGAWLRRKLHSLMVRTTADMKFTWRHRALREAGRLFAQGGFDVVLSSYMPLAPHMVALGLRRKGYAFRWVADMRDEMSQLTLSPRYVQRRIVPYERRILRSADLVTTVSDPIIEGFRSICGHDRFLRVMNGYEFDEVHDASFQPRFTMAFVGHFYWAITPDHWFRAVSELLHEGALRAEECRIELIGDHRNVRIPEHLTSVVHVAGEVPHDEAFARMLRADTLVLIHPTGRKGVYTGKIFDYLPTNKPILALCDPRDVAGAAELLRETGAGFAVDNDDIAGIKAQILRCYSIWRNREVLPRDWDRIRQYTRRNQTRILIDRLAGGAHPASGAHTHGGERD